MHPTDRSRGGPDLSPGSTADRRDAGVDLVAMEPPSLTDRLRLLSPGDVLDRGGIRSILGGGIALALGMGVLAWLLLGVDRVPPEDVLPLAVPSAAPSVTPSVPAPAAVLVHAAGAVSSPGLYELAGGSRVADLLTAAGGPATDADLDRLNLAEVVEDGTRVFVPRIGEALPPEVEVPAGGPPAEDRPVNLNTATAAELDGLPGIGPATAEAIIEHRTTSGPFVSVDALLDVRGIGEAKMAELRPLVTVG